MDMHKLSTILIRLGTIFTIGAVLWWAAFYGGIAKEFNANLGEAISCLYSSGGPCGFISGLAQMAGRTPYTPVIFWIGIGLLACGIIVRLAQTDEQAKTICDHCGQPLGFLTHAFPPVPPGEEWCDGCFRTAVSESVTTQSSATDLPVTSHTVAVEIPSTPAASAPATPLTNSEHLRNNRARLRKVIKGIGAIIFAGAVFVLTLWVGREYMSPHSENVKESVIVPAPKHQGAMGHMCSALSQATTMWGLADGTDGDQCARALKFCSTYDATDCVVTFKGPYSLDQSNTVTVHCTLGGRDFTGIGRQVIQEAFDFVIQSKWYGCTFRVIPALADTVNWGCDARPPDICYFSIYSHTGGSRNFTMRAGQRDQISGVMPGKDTYCVTVNQGVPNPNTCSKRTVKRDYNN